MKRTLLNLCLAAMVLGSVACSNRVNIRVKGSDTMLQLSTAWAEAYRKVNPNVQINAGGGGSGTGIAALQDGTADICTSSRPITAEEREKIKAATGKDVMEHPVCFDALALYTHKQNPLTQISVEELQQIWAEGGTIDQWEQVGGTGGKISLIGRQNSSGTYDYFREHICGKTPDKKQREFRQGVSELVGSAEVVESVSKTPSAMGYSGMGYKNDTVNWLKISAKKGEEAIEPGADAARSGKYPIARQLYLYTLGEPTGEVKAFIDWVKGPEGQAIVNKEGFISLQ